MHIDTVMVYITQLKSVSMHRMMALQLQTCTDNSVVDFLNHLVSMYPEYCTGP